MRLIFSIAFGAMLLMVFMSCVAFATVMIVTQERFECKVNMTKLGKTDQEVEKLCN